MKGNDVFLCCLSATVSSFANGGLIATNENLAIFNKDPVVLLLMIAQVLGGNTLFALFLRWVMRALKKLTGRDEFKCMLKSTVGRKMTRDPLNFSTLRSDQVISRHNLQVARSTMRMIPRIDRGLLHQVITVATEMLQLLEVAGIASASLSWLLLVMLFCGRLKKFSAGGGSARKLY
ncbi:hypothetical protein B296_00054720 [Ensete ventricosum]|uniref:Uncharacterized protein n=1 Tax=Ensete ventricosum TaxID=4639 RepID=A0A426X496_ENSVE|nr:hypothetical protein B296_00054720 [Ensete ventricosum]